MAAGADFIKTSTGKIQPAATLPVALVMLEAIRDFHDRTGRMVGMKPAGGIRTAKQAIQHPGGGQRDPEPPTPAHPRLVPPRRLQPPQRLPHAAGQGTHRPLRSGDYFTKDYYMAEAAERRAERGLRPGSRGWTTRPRRGDQTTSSCGPTTGC